MRRTNGNARKKVWTPQAIRALGVRTDIKTSADVLGISDRTLYELVRSGECPLKVLRLGNKYVVPVQSLLEYLGIASEEPASIQRPALTVVTNSPEVA
jgi:excisionase family DNA binding protein